MSKRTGLPSKRHHVWLYDEDWDFLVANYGPGSHRATGAAQIIRLIIHNYVGKIKEKVNQELSQRGPLPHAKPNPGDATYPSSEDPDNV